MKHRHATNSSRGFTLIEMMIVVSLMLVLISVAVPIYNRVILRAREAVLRQDLFTLRQLISQYTLDQRKPPHSLDDLVAGTLPAKDSVRSANQSNRLVG